MATKNATNSPGQVAVPGAPKEPGLIYRESDSPGAGSLIAEEIDSPRNRAKGNLGYGDLPDPKALSGPVPFRFDEE